MKAMVIKEIHELSRDRRTLGMLLALPLILLIIFGYAANFTVDRIRVTLTGPAAETLAAELRGPLAGIAPELDIVAIAPQRAPNAAKTILRNGESDLVIHAHATPDAPLADRVRVTLDGSRLFVAQTATSAIVALAAEDARIRAEALGEQMEATRAEAERRQAAAERFASELGTFLGESQAALRAGHPPPPPPSPPAELDPLVLPDLSVPQLDPDRLVTVLFNPDLKTSWVMVPGLIGLILTFVGTLITSIGLVRERESGALEQIAVMPLRPSAIILGKIIPYFVLAVIDLVLVTALGTWLFGVPFEGSVWTFAIIAVAFLFVVLGLGALVSTLSHNTGQAIQLAILIVVPQVLLSGLIFPLDAMPIGVRWIGYLLPLTWFREAVNGVMLRAAELGTLWGPLLVLVGMAVVIFGAATGRLRADLTRGGAKR